jgi:predicted phage tail protein
VISGASLVPQGTVSITTITTTEVTSNVSWTYELEDATGFEYSLDLGTSIATSSNPQTISNLTTGQTYSVRVRATNQYGPGVWSESVEFTTLAGINIISSPLRNETFTLLSNVLFSIVDVYLVSTGELVNRFSNITTDNDGKMQLTSGTFIVGTDYRLWYELPSGNWGTEKVIAI